MTDFLDSNVLVYLVDAGNPEKQATSRRLVQAALRSGQGQVSFQVVQETLNTITRKFRTTVNPLDARQLMNEVLVPLWRIMPTPRLYEQALDLQTRYGYSFYDSLIIAAALAAGCTRLLSEDMQHGQRVESLTIVNPFLT
jgi:predicted nucleic acid-binding protein